MDLHIHVVSLSLFCAVLGVCLLCMLCFLHVPFLSIRKILYKL